MTCTIHGTYISNNPLPAGSEVHFLPDISAVITSDGIRVKDRYTAVIVNNAFSIVLPDNQTGNPTGWTYRVDEKFPNGRAYHVGGTPPYLAPGGTYDLKDIAPVDVTTGVAMYVGPPGPRGAAGGDPLGFHFAAPASTWTITHNLNTYPPVVLFADDSPTEPTYTGLSYPDANTVVAEWPSPTSGWAYIL